MPSGCILKMASAREKPSGIVVPFLGSLFGQWHDNKVMPDGSFTTIDREGLFQIQLSLHVLLLLVLAVFLYASAGFIKLLYMRL